MNRMDFVTSHIVNFTPTEVIKTGAKLKDVQVITMVSLQTLRTGIKRRIGLIWNGLTTGKHLAPEHPGGLAADCFLYEADGRIIPDRFVEFAVLAGFRGIGVYYNHQIKRYSFHLDLRKHPKFWMASKKLTNDRWTYQRLFNDPKEYKLT